MSVVESRFTDQMGRSILLKGTPKRIVSLVPSQTELLLDLGLEDRVVGRTHFCIHPKGKVDPIPRIGGTKKLQLDAIRALQPDLIIANKEENEKEQVEALAEEFPVWISDIKTTEDALDMILEVGMLCGKEDQAQTLQKEIKASLERIRAQQERFSAYRVLYAIWKGPWMFAGRDTFIHELLTLAGFKNACEGLRYPELDNRAIQRIQPDLLLLSSEPYPFSAKHEKELATTFPGSRPLLVDGEMFSWYGSRMRLLEGYLDELSLRVNSG